VNWPTPQLQEFCRIIQGGRSGLSGDNFVLEGFPAYGAGGLNGYLPTHEFDEPAVILSSIGARCGKCFYAEGKWASLANTQLIFPDSTKADVRFLWIQLNNESRWLRSGTGQPFIKPSDVKTHRVLLPPLAEQCRIAEVLDQAEALRAKRRAALTELDSLTQSLFLDLFGDPATNPKGWLDAQLGKLCEKVIDCPHATPVYATSRTEYPCIRSSDIQDGDLTFADAKYVEKLEYEKRIARGKPQVGDVIYCREGARFGNAALITREMTLCLGQRMMLFRPHPKSAVGEYLWAFLSSPAAYRQATSRVGGSAAPHVNIRDIISFRLPHPPIELQREFARRVAAVEKLKTAQRASLGEMDALFASLQHRAFRGEL
jgi:type I restriction enzyme, S subunit